MKFTQVWPDFHRFTMCLMWTKSSSKIWKSFSGMGPQVILLILSPCLIAFAPVFFYINLFVYCRWVNAALRNVIVLPSNLCLVLVNVDTVLMGGWSLFICICVTRINELCVSGGGCLYLHFLAKFYFLQLVLTLFCEHIFNLANGMVWFSRALEIKQYPSVLIGCLPFGKCHGRKSPFPFQIH